MNAGKTGVAIVGCGNIAAPYARNLAEYPEIELVGAADLDRSRAETLTREHGGKVFDSLEQLLADDDVDIVVNLTIHHAHYEVTRKCLEAGKHVHSEKPLALAPEQAHELVTLADRSGLRLGASPFTWMGEVQQAAWQQIQSGKLGTVRLVYAEVNHGRIESWHPNPEPFYAVGPWFDVGVYPLTLLTAFFGPVRWIQALGTVLYPDRRTREDRPFHIATPDCILAVLGLEDGPVVRLTCNFYVRDTQQQGIEFHGDRGSLFLESWHNFNARLAFAEHAKGFVDVPVPGHPPKGVEWGRGIRDLAAAIREDRPHRACGEQAAHIVDVLAAGMASAREGRRVDIRTVFTRPQVDTRNSAVSSS